MGGLRKIFSGLTLALLVAPIGGPAHAMPGEMQEMVRLFASCAGRYSATMEHEWLMGRDGRVAEAQRRGFVALLDAVLPDARAAGMTGPQVLSLRIEALPPPWQTWWAYTVYALVVTGFLFVSLRTHHRRVRRREALKSATEAAELARASGAEFERLAETAVEAGGKSLAKAVELSEEVDELRRRGPLESGNRELGDQVRAVLEERRALAADFELDGPARAEVFGELGRIFGKIAEIEERLVGCLKASSA